MSKRKRVYTEEEKVRNRKYQHEWYIKNRQKQIDRNNKIKKEKKEWFNKYKTTLKCIQCGEKHPATLDFHHRNPKNKHSSISNMMMCSLSLKRVKAEIKKCDILCSNCHRILHWNNKTASRPTKGQPDG